MPTAVIERGHATALGDEQRHVERVARRRRGDRVWSRRDAGRVEDPDLVMIGGLRRLVRRDLACTCVARVVSLIGVIEGLAHRSAPSLSPQYTPSTEPRSPAVITWPMREPAPSASLVSAPSVSKRALASGFPSCIRTAGAANALSLAPSPTAASPSAAKSTRPHATRRRGEATLEVVAGASRVGQVALRAGALQPDVRKQQRSLPAIDASDSRGGSSCRQPDPPPGYAATRRNSVRRERARSVLRARTSNMNTFDDSFT